MNISSNDGLRRYCIYDLPHDTSTGSLAQVMSDWPTDVQRWFVSGENFPNQTYLVLEFHGTTYVLKNFLTPNPEDNDIRHMIVRFKFESTQEPEFTDPEFHPPKKYAHHTIGVGDTPMNALINAIEEVRSPQGIIR